MSRASLMDGFGVTTLGRIWVTTEDLQPRESEIVDAVFQSEKSIRGEPVESCKLRYFNSFEFFDHSVLQKHTEMEFTMN
jgi:hypothetical protein